MAYDFNSLFSPFETAFSDLEDTSDGVMSSQLPIGTYASQAAVNNTIPSGLTGPAVDAYVSGQNNPALPATPTATTGFKSILGNFVTALANIDQSVPMLGSIDSSVGLNPNVPGSTLSNTGGAASALSFVSFLSDLPRVATVVLGLVFIIAGVFALTRGPAVNVVSSAVRGALVA